MRVVLWVVGMPRYLILPYGERVPALEVEDSDTSNILNMMQRSGYRHADIFEDDNYLLSVRLGFGEVWSIYQRREDHPHLVRASKRDFE